MPERALGNPRSDNAIPDRINLYVCDKCGRTGWSGIEVRPGHFSSGERCGGTVQRVVYLRAPYADEADALCKKLGIAP